MEYYGLFVVQMEEVTPFVQAEEADKVTDELYEQYEDTRENQSFCIFGKLHNYKTDN